ncbi:hypothetical protein Tco_0016580 [Tanacetum coccineum]
MVHGATSVAKSPYRLAPLEMQELSDNKLREYKTSGFFIRPSPFSHGTPMSIVKNRSMVHLKLVLEVYLPNDSLQNFSKFVKPLTPLTERNQKYEWGAEREEAFQTLKNDLCDASINQIQVLITNLAISNVETSKVAERANRNLCHVKTNVVIDALRRKERVKPRRVRAMAMTIRVKLKRCFADASLHEPLDEIKVDKTLRFIKEPIEIMDREVKSLKRSRISLVKVRWNYKRGPEFVLVFVEAAKQSWTIVWLCAYLLCDMDCVLERDRFKALVDVSNERDHLIVVTDDSKWDEMDRNAVANLHLALTDGVLSSIEEKKSAKEIWDHLARLYEARSLHNKKFLKRKLYAFRMTESTSVTEHSLMMLPSPFWKNNRRNNREDRQTSSRQVEALVVTRGRSIEPGSSGSHNHGKMSLALQKMVMLCVVKQRLQMKAGKRFADDHGC